MAWKGWRRKPDDPTADNDIRSQLADLARWLLILPVIFLLLFSCGRLAAQGVTPEMKTAIRSNIILNYQPWENIPFQPLSKAMAPEVIEEEGSQIQAVAPGPLWLTPTEVTAVALLTTNTPTPKPTATFRPTASQTSAPISPPTEIPPPTTPSTVTATQLPTLTFTPSKTPTQTSTPTRTYPPPPPPPPTRTPTTQPPPPPTTTPTPTITRTPTRTATASPTATRTSTASPTVTRTLTATSTQTATSTPTSTNTATNTPTPTRTLTPTATSTATQTPTVTTTPTETNTPTITPTPTPTQTPTSTPIVTSPFLPPGPPDGAITSIFCGQGVIYDLGGLISNPALVYYENAAGGPLVLMDIVIVAVSNNSNGPWNVVFYWGDGNPFNNGSIQAYHYASGENPNEQIPTTELFGIPPLQTGIAIPISSALGSYQYVMISTDNCTNPAEVDSIETYPSYPP